MTNPQSDEQKANVLYVLERFTTFQRWKKRAMWIIWSVTGAAFVVTIVGLYLAKPEFSYGVPVAAGVAFGVMMLMLALVLPRFPAPSLRCPHCSGQVPLFQPPKFLKPFEPVKICPNCQRELPG